MYKGCTCGDDKIDCVDCMKDYIKRQDAPKSEIVELPDGVTDIRLQQYEQQENPFNGTEQQLMWLCRIADTCPLDGTPDKSTTGYGNTQVSAYENALKNWNA